MQTNDELWKGALEDFSFEFVEKFYPDLYPFIDMDHPQPIEFLDKELAQLHRDSDIGSKRVDKLMGVHLRGVGEMRLLYIHVEVQGYQDDEFDKRNFVYFYRLYDLYGEKITVLVIFTDDNPNYRPSVYEFKFMGVELTYKFPIYKIMDESPEELEASKNLFDAAILTAYWAIQKKRGKLTEEDFAELKLDLIRRYFIKKVNKEKIRRLFDFIKQYVRFEKPEIAATFERKFDDILKIEQNMGISEILVRQAEDRAELRVQTVLSELYAAQEAAQQAQAAQLAAQEVAQVAAQQAREEARKEALTEAEMKMEIERHNDRKNIVANMRRKNYSAESIADLIGYPIEEVESFFKELDSLK
jgi:hypothetical protein